MIFPPIEMIKSLLTPGENRGECICDPKTQAKECKCKPEYEGSACQCRTDKQACETISGVSNINFKR